MLMEDANFRLRSRLRSSDEKDPSLGPGLAYFVASDDYLKHLSKYIDQDEVSSQLDMRLIRILHQSLVMTDLSLRWLRSPMAGEQQEVKGSSRDWRRLG